MTISASMSNRRHGLESYRHLITTYNNSVIARWSTRFFRQKAKRQAVFVLHSELVAFQLLTIAHHLG